MAGFIALLNTKNTPDTLDEMTQTIIHRGRDYRLNYKDDNLELSFINHDLGYAFDKKELLETKSHVFLLVGYLNNVDEVIELATKIRGQAVETPIQAIENIFENRGMAFLADFLKGNYVVLIYDKEQASLEFLRDRFGLQPIYYYKVNDGFIIVSETKALLAHPQFKKVFNQDALVPYLVFQSPTLRETFFKGVYSLPPAIFGRFDKLGLRKQIYWDVDFSPEEISLDEAVDEINELIAESMEKKTKYFKDKSMIGQSLSGGVDSSYLAARFKPDKTFTVGYNDKEFSEIDNAKELSEIIGAKHFAEIVDSKKSFEEIDKIAYLCDMPFANLSAIPMYYLSKSIRKQTAVVMGGEGADEFFGGYYEYTEPSQMEKYKKLPLALRKFIGRRMLKSKRDFKGKNFLIKGLPVEEWYIGQAKIFHENEARNIVKDPFRDAPSIQSILQPYYNKVSDKSDLQKKQYLDFHVWMINDINLKADRMNMGNGVQLITPILDEDLLDFARKLPDNLKIQGNKVKIAFRKAALAYLPEAWAKRKKLGYVVPVKNWLKEEEYQAVMFEKLLGSTASQFFDTDLIKKLIDENTSGKRAQHRKLWTIYMFIIWYEEYFIKR